MEYKQTSTPNSDGETLWSLLNDAADASLPYNGTSGWSGTDTSEERAITADTTGDTSRRQREAIEHLFMAHKDGLTWRGLARITGWHHGQASGVLSVLHKEGKIARLLDRRDRCRIYVHLAHIGDRETDTQGRKPKACPNCGHHL